jgi:hypothetical protein
MALGSTQPLTKMSIRNIPGGEGWRVRNADNLTDRLSTKCGSLNISQPYGSPQPVTGITLPYLHFHACHTLESDAHMYD